MYLADPDPVRTAVRKFIYERQRDRTNLDDAIQGVDLRTLSPRSLSWLANTYTMAGAADESDRIFKLAIQQYSGDFMLNFDYAYALANTNRWQEAIRIYHRCLAIRPDVPGIWKNLSVALEEVGEEEAAREAEQRFEELSFEQASEPTT